MTIEYKDSKRIVLDTSVTTTNTQATGSTSNNSIYFNHSTHQRRFLGERFNTGHALVGKTIKEVQFDLLKSSTAPSSVFDLVVLSTSDVVTTLESVNLSSIGTSFATYTFNSFTPFILGAGERIGIYANAQSHNSSGRYLRVANSGSDEIANATMYAIHDEGNGDVTGDLKYIIKYQTSTKPTNVPDNSILIEKDTAKRYWYSPVSADTAWSQTTSNDGVNVQYGTSAQTSKLGQKFETNHANVGKTFTQVTVRVKRYTHASGDASAGHILYCKVYNSSGSARETATTTYVYSTLSTSYADITFTFATSITIGANEIVGFESNGGAYDVETFNFRVNSSSTESDTVMIDYRNSAWGTTFAAWEMMMTLGTPATATWTRDKFPAWYEQTSRDNSVAINDYDSRPIVLGHKNESGSSFNTKSATFLITKYGTGGNGTLTARIYDSSAVLKHTSTNSIVVSSLSTSPTFESVTFNFSSGAIVEDDWVIGVHTTGNAEGDNFAAVGTYVVTGKTVKLNSGSSTFIEYSDRLITITVKGDN